jgi:hypothetical protein
MVIRRKVVLLIVLTMLKVVQKLLDWVDRVDPKPTHLHADDLILVGDPGGRYVTSSPPVLRVISGGAHAD